MCKIEVSVVQFIGILYSILKRMINCKYHLKIGLEFYICGAKIFCTKITEKFSFFAP